MPESSIHSERELREQWQDMHEKFHQKERESVLIAKQEVDRRLDGMNELRDQITSERGEFLRRDVYDREHSSLRETMDGRLKALENNRANMEGRLWAIGAVLTLVMLALRYFGK